MPQRFNFFGAELVAVFRRHLELAPAQHRLEHPALVGVTGDQGRLAALAAFEQTLAGAHIELRFAVFGFPMAAEAFGLQQRMHFLEEEIAGLARLRRGRRRSGDGSGDGHDCREQSE